MVWIFCYLKHRKLGVVNFVLISLLNHGNTVEREDDGREDEVGEEDEEDEDDGGVLSECGTAGEDEESVSRDDCPDDRDDGGGDPAHQELVLAQHHWRD